MTSIPLTLSRVEAIILAGHLLKGAPDYLIRERGKKIREALETILQQGEGIVRMLDQLGEELKSGQGELLDKLLEDCCRGGIPTVENVESVIKTTIPSWVQLEPELRQDMLDQVYNIIIDQYQPTDSVPRLGT